jgi:hypothetical protein
MLARAIPALFIVLCAAHGWSSPDPGQSRPEGSEHALLPIDPAAFEIAAATGGFYYFWRPGEFSRFAALDAPELFIGRGQTVEQIDGRLQGTIDLPFEVHPDDAEIFVRAGLQSLGEIALFAPGARAPYAGDASTRTSHMLIARVPEPTPGTWTVRLTGEGIYLVNVTARRGEGGTDLAEASWPSGDGSQHAQADLDHFRSASPEGRWDLFRRLPPARRHSLARSLLDDVDPAVAYVAAGSLARDGDLDQAIPVFARILVRGQDETALRGRMGYDWIHDDDDGLAERITRALAEHLRAHLESYSTAERRRAELFLAGSGDGVGP